MRVPASIPKQLILIASLIIPWMIGAAWAQVPARLLDQRCSLLESLSKSLETEPPARRRTDARH